MSSFAPLDATPESESELPPSERGPAPWLTYGFMAVCVGICAWLNLVELRSGGGKLWRLLAPEAARIWSGEWWGLLTAAFVHANLWHLFFNVWWLRDFGKLLEPRWKAGRFAIFTLVAALVGCAAQLFFTGQTGIGLSGVIYAYFGYVAAARRSDPGLAAFLTPKVIKWMIGWFVLCIGLTAANILAIGNYAHGGGLVFGWLVGMAYAERRWVGLCKVGLALLAAMVVLSVSWMPWNAEWQHRAEWLGFYEMKDRARAGDTEAQLAYGSLLLQYPEQEAEGERWLRKAMEAGNLEAMNNLAWRLANDPRPTVRNPEGALSLARQACERDTQQRAAYIDTMASAYAAMGLWDKAVETQRKALARLQPQEEGSRAELNARLQAYLAHQARR